MTSTPHFSPSVFIDVFRFPFSALFSFFPTCSPFLSPPFFLPPLPCRHQRSGSQAPEEQSKGDPDTAPLQQLLLLPQPQRDQPQPGGTPSGALSVIGRSSTLNSKPRVRPQLGVGDEPKRFYSTLPGPFRGRESTPNGRRKEEAGQGGGGVKHSLYQSPHLLLLQGYNRQVSTTGCGQCR